MDESVKMPAPPAPVIARERRSAQKEVERAQERVPRAER